LVPSAPSRSMSALLAQTTFLPALLLAVGRRAFWPRVPRSGDAGRHESGLWAGIGGRVACRPARVTLCAVVVLCAACGAALAQLPSVSLTEVGTAVAVAIGVLLDTLLLRTVLVPASLLTIGERASWAARPESRRDEEAKKRVRSG
jgi:uncharacterized membrane protein YdfJ with MMPL/SSD domain